MRRRGFSLVEVLVAVLVGLFALKSENGEVEAE